jgi:hypothetical protein
VTKPLRQIMPFTASIIDDFRTNWPESGVVQAVRAGIDGQPTFHAKENGHEVGTPIPYDPDKAISVADLIAAGLLVIAKPQPPKKGQSRG